MREEFLCPQCKKSVTADVPQGLCPACLLSVADPNSPSLEKGEMMEDCQTLPPQTPARPGEETTAAPEGGFIPQPASATCRKLGIRFWDYLQDRVRGIGQIARLAEVIRQRAAETTAEKAQAVPT